MFVSWVLLDLLAILRANGVKIKTYFSIRILFLFNFLLVFSFTQPFIKWNLTKHRNILFFTPAFLAFGLAYDFRWGYEKFFLFVFDLTYILIFKVLIKPVLYLAYCSAKKHVHFRYLRPFWANLVVHIQNKGVFFLSPLSPYDGGINDIVPPLSALSAKPAREEPRNDYPVLSPKILDFVSENLVLLIGPLSTADLRLQRYLLRPVVWFKIKGLGMCLVDVLKIKPSFKTSNFSLVLHELAKTMPRLVRIYLN